MWNLLLGGDLIKAKRNFQDICIVMALFVKNHKNQYLCENFKALSFGYHFLAYKGIFALSIIILYEMKVNS